MVFDLALIDFLMGCEKNIKKHCFTFLGYHATTHLYCHTFFKFYPSVHACMDNSCSWSQPIVQWGVQNIMEIVVVIHRVPYIYVLYVILVVVILVVIPKYVHTK